MSAEHRVSVHPAGDLRTVTEPSGQQFLHGPQGKWLHGIDVSHHQAPGSVDWATESVGDMGVSWAYARAAYGSRLDATFPAHVQAIRAAGLRVGGYLFYRQTVAATEQLRTFTEALHGARVGRGDLAPVVDLEWNAAFDGRPVPASFNTDGRWLIEKLHDQFGQCMIYLCGGFWQTLGGPEWCYAHPWWVANYGRDLVEPWLPAAAKRAVQWAAWQYEGAPLDRNFARSLPLAHKGPVYLEH